MNSCRRPSSRCCVRPTGSLHRLSRWELCKRFRRCQSVPVVQLIQRMPDSTLRGLIGRMDLRWESSLPGFACQVPVFRFALERWEADSYTHGHRPRIGRESCLPPTRKRSPRFCSRRGSADGSGARKSESSRSIPRTVGEGTPERQYGGLSYPHRNGAGPDAPRDLVSVPLIMENARGRWSILPRAAKIVARLLNGESAAWVHGRVR